ncbi:MAG: SPFH domain-containing protein [Planctomycetota bacterium]|jgi:membrane protease subunit HflK
MSEEENEQKIDDVAVAADEDQLDAAGKSLTDALRVSFVILKLIMAVLVLLFFVSGVFRVQPNEQALVLRLGKIRGVGQERLLGPGLQWAFPAPIDEIVRIVTKKKQTLAIDSFWYFQREEDKLRGRKHRPGPTLSPKRGDGYCLTRNDRDSDTGENDYNIVHAKWELTYTIQRPELFFKSIYYKAPTPGQDFLDVVSETLDPLIKAMAEDAIVTTMVNYSIDEAIVSESRIPNDVSRLLQAKLDQIESGIKVDSIRISERITWPLQVDDAFQESNKASQLSDGLVTGARSYSEKILNEAGGPAVEEVLVALKDPSISDASREKLLSRLTGTCQEKISLARAYRTKTVETAKADAEYLAMLLPEYRKRPELVLQKLYNDAIEEVLNNAEEKFFVQPSVGGEGKELRIFINRDPTIGKAGTQSETEE